MRANGILQFFFWRIISLKYFNEPKKDESSLTLATSGVHIHDGLTELILQPWSLASSRALCRTRVHKAPLDAPYVHRFGCADTCDIDVIKQIVFLSIQTYWKWLIKIVIKINIKNPWFKFKSDSLRLVSFINGATAPIMYPAPATLIIKLYNKKNQKSSSSIEFKFFWTSKLYLGPVVFASIISLWPKVGNWKAIIIIVLLKIMESFQFRNHNFRISIWTTKYWMPKPRIWNWWSIYHL